MKNFALSTGVDDELLEIATLCGLDPDAISPMSTGQDEREQQWTFFKRPHNMRKAGRCSVLVFGPSGVLKPGRLLVDEERIAVSHDAALPFLVVWIAGSNKPEALKRRPLAAVEAVWLNPDFPNQLRILAQLTIQLQMFELLVAEELLRSTFAGELWSVHRKHCYRALHLRLTRAAAYQDARLGLSFCPLRQLETAETLGIEPDELGNRLASGKLSHAGVNCLTGDDLVPRVMTRQQAAAELHLRPRQLDVYFDRHGVLPFTNGLLPARLIGILAARKRFHHRRLSATFTDLSLGLAQVRMTLRSHDPVSVQRLISGLLEEGLLISFQKRGCMKRYVDCRHMDGLLAALRLLRVGENLCELRRKLLPMADVCEYLAIRPEQFYLLVNAKLLEVTLIAGNLPHCRLDDAADLLLTPSLLVSD